MQTKKAVEDLLLASENEEWLRRAFIASHVISDKFIDVYNPSNRNYFRGDSFSSLEIDAETFGKCDVIAVVDRIISVYVIGAKAGRSSRKVVSIKGNECSIKAMSKTFIKKDIQDAQNKYTFLPESEWKILYIPFSEKLPTSPENYEIFLFREFRKGKFIVNSLTTNVSPPEEVVREGLTKKDIIQVVLDEAFEDE